jgi:hypothetical protein
MKIAISIPDALFEAAEVMADRLGVSRSELYRRALAQYLRLRSREAVTEALDEVYGRDEETAALDPAVAWLQSANLARGVPKEW